jgi:hypothetical protein
MVWSQYVYEANEGYDVEPSDEEDYEDELHLSIEDWQIKYSDELWALWDMIQQLLRDAFMEHELMSECTFSDFAEFCYETHDDECDFVWIPYEAQLSYIWRHIQECVSDTDILSGATFDHWVRFAAHHTKQNNITIY